MNFIEQGIVGVRPLAELHGGLAGPRVIVEISHQRGGARTCELLPPSYDLDGAIDVQEHILGAALEKHGYQAVDRPALTDFEQLEEYLREICQPEAVESESST